MDDLTLYHGQGSSNILGDIIDKHLTFDEQLLAEGLGALFWKRSLEIWGKNETLSGEELETRDRCDGSRHGTDFYKFLAYQMIARCKATTKEMDDLFDYGAHSWKDLLIIMFGPEVKNLLKNPGYYSFA